MSVLSDLISTHDHKFTQETPIPFGAQLLETALLWLRADVYGDLAEVERLMAKENVDMYGTVGREEAIHCKRKFLPLVRGHKTQLIWINFIEDLPPSCEPVKTLYKQFSL